MFFTAPAQHYRKLKIAIDYHRTVAQIDEEIQRLILHNCKVRIPLYATRRRFAEEYNLSLQDFDAIQSQVVESIPFMIRNIRPAPGSILVMNNLIRDGHAVDILTASGEYAHVALCHWLRYLEINVPTRAIGRWNSKRVVAADYDVALEDDIEQAEACALNEHTSVFLITTRINRYARLPERITRVENFYEFYEQIRKLSALSYNP